MSNLIQTQKEIKPKEKFFVVGDIHGCIDELEVLLEEIIKAGFNDNSHLLFVGDYIDRGKNSKAVVDRLIDFSAGKNNITFLRGNHEDMFLHFCGLDGSNGEFFMVKTDSLGNSGCSKFQKDISLRIDLNYCQKNI